MPVPDAVPGVPPDDHVRSRPPFDPARCGAANGERVLGNCAVCRFDPAPGEHCFLYEMCDRCYSPDDPCGPAQVLKASVGLEMP